MPDHPIRRRVLRGIGVVVGLLGLLVLTQCGTIRAGLLVSDAIAPSAALADQVEVTRHEVPGAQGATTLYLYRPITATGPLPAFVLSHGAIEDGAHDPRLVRFARALAARGATVATPELPSLAGFRLDADEPGRVAEVALWLADDEALTEGPRVALLGISVGGAYGLVVAGDDRMRGRVSAVLAFGAYDDLGALLTHWMTEPAPTDGLLDPFTEGRQAVLLGNLERLVDPVDRAAVEGHLRALLKGGRPPPPTGVGPSAQQVLAAAASGSALDVATADALLAPLHEAVVALSPIRAAVAADVPVYLLHGEQDPVVSVESARRLEQYLRAGGAPVSLHVTGLFGHVDAGETPSLWEAWPLLSFLADYLSDAGL